MERDERYEINSQGAIVVGQPVTLTSSEKKSMIDKMFSINGWSYTLLNEITSTHYHIELKNENLQIAKTFHLYHGNVRKEDPERNREEKKIQLGTDNDPRTHMDDGIILGFYIYEDKSSLSDTIIVAWPIEQNKNYPANPSLRVNMKTDVLPAKNAGYYVDKTSGKNLVVFRPEFIYHYIENYMHLQYGLLDDESNEDSNVSTFKFNLGYESDEKYPRNRIFFGAPGTGKSYKLNEQKDILLGIDSKDYERVTFHPDYSYANFVGTYKPVPCVDSTGKEAITYEYVPGPFMRTLVKALQNSKKNDIKPFLLVVEEINRANVAAVFGDVFQLLDRGENEVSEYPIATSKDMRTYLAKEENLGGSPEDYEEIKIPDNMFIWATMNSADQGVYPMDTAFKRRWDFTYLGIDENESGIANRKVILGTGTYERVVEWNKLRKAINSELLKYKVNEDKLLGPYFVSKKILPEDETEMIDQAKFIDIFKSKIIMYLFDDAARQKSPTLFGGCEEKSKNQYSKICKEFEKKGVFIFCEDIINQFTELANPTAIEEEN